MKEEDQYMTKIKIMSVRDEDIPYINEWAKQNNVDVDLTKEMLTETTVDTVKDLMVYRYLNNIQFQKRFCEIETIWN